MKKKSNRKRGSTTHGWGSMKKHRGKGNKGGSGIAGTGKRASTKRPSIWHLKKPLGKSGFVNRQKAVLVSWNIDDLMKYCEKAGVKDAIDLSKLKVDKLLGRGQVTKKVSVTVYNASKKAVEKLKNAGCSVNVIAQIEETQ